MSMLMVLSMEVYQTCHPQNHCPMRSYTIVKTIQMNHPTNHCPIPLLSLNPLNLPNSIVAAIASAVLWIDQPIAQPSFSLIPILPITPRQKRHRLHLSQSTAVDLIWCVSS